MLRLPFSGRLSLRPGDTFLRHSLLNSYPKAGFLNTCLWPGKALLAGVLSTEKLGTENSVRQVKLETGRILLMSEQIIRDLFQVVDACNWDSMRPFFFVRMSFMNVLATMQLLVSETFSIFINMYVLLPQEPISLSMWSLEKRVAVAGDASLA